MRIRLVILGLVPVLLLLAGGTAWADGGPHGGYGPVTDKCAGCHRAHTAIGPYLLVSTSATGLCITCHGGSGADTNVVNGASQASVTAGSPRGLKGGGFTNAIMDTNYDGAAVSASVTSKHQVDGIAGTMWGNGGIGSGVSITGSITLSCASCHDPHGNASSTHTATYRLLRNIPTDSGATAGVDVAEQTGTKVYTVNDPDNQYFGESYGVRLTSLSTWCAECHTRYRAGSGSGHTSSGDSTFMYRHLSTGTMSVGCTACHVGHGTSATMGPLSGAVAWPNGGMAPNGDARSSLLRLDNRGVCEVCHALQAPG